MTRLEHLARRAAEAVHAAFDRYLAEFLDVTRRARRRFEERDWVAGQRDASERLELYRRVLDELELELREALGSELEETLVWRAMKSIHSRLIAGGTDVELAETFFNSITRRVFDTVGVDPMIEYVDLDIRRARYGPGSAIHRTYPHGGDTPELVARVLADYRFEAPYADLERDVALVAAAVDDTWRTAVGGAIARVELVESVFFRATGAYLVGRIVGAQRSVPLVLVLLNGDAGVEVDAVLLTEREVSIVFSYTRSHFQVEVEHASDLIRFLSSILPHKRIAELYISLGHSKHGKTEMYRDLLGHLNRSLDRFDHAPGQKGMVMVVFTLRSYDFVFKVIRDDFAYPKTTTREGVLERYQLVFEHDRAGRLIEAQEFEHLTFDRLRFTPELLEELQTAAASSVTVTGDEVAIHHLYVERRVEPLDLYLREADEADTRRVVVDFGQAIRDLARSNIFPGDMLLKNFGVSRQGRVIFYDYDELCLVTECNYRDMPVARSVHEELAAEPWFYVGASDVFPEEFIRFLGLTPAQREIFVDAHGELLTADFWRELKRRHERHEVLDVFPYPARKRLRA